MLSMTFTKYKTQQKTYLLALIQVGNIKRRRHGTTIQIKAEVKFLFIMQFPMSIEKIQVLVENQGRKCIQVTKAKLRNLESLNPKLRH